MIGTRNGRLASSVRQDILVSPVPVQETLELLVPAPTPALDLFGGANAIQSGWNLAPVSAIPEPSTAAMVVIER